MSQTCWDPLTIGRKLQNSAPKRKKWSKVAPSEKKHPTENFAVLVIFIKILFKRFTSPLIKNTIRV